jgi:hypothetical protein
VSDSLEKQAHAAAIAARRLPERLQYWTSQLEESGHKFVSRRDSNAAIEVLGALECIACEYAELRKKSVTLHLDARFFLSGPQSDISDVLNPVYETLLRITDDAISSKNERVAQHCIDGMGRMAVHAMSVHAARTHGQPIAPLAFAAVYYLGRAARAVLAANMQDAILHAIRALTRVLLSRPSDIDLTGIAETVNNSLFEIASDGEVKRNGAAVFRSVEAMLQSVKFEIARETFDYDSFASTLHQLFRLFPMEVIADSAGLRHLQVFPPYHLGFHASIPMLLQDIAQKVQLDPERPWLDPFHDLSKAMEGVRDHYRALTQIDFGHTLLHKHTIESLGAVLRVLFNQITCPPKGTGEHVQTVVHDLLQQISWMSGFFPDHAKEYRHVSDATACLTILGLDALDHDQSVIAEACVSALSKIAIKVGAKQGSWELADVHRDMEIFARAVGMKKDMKLAARVRSMMTMPLGLTPEMDKLYFEAQQTRFLQLDEALARAGRRPYMIRIDPVERLYEILNRRTDIDEPEDQS